MLWYTASLKTLSEKTHWDKNLIKGKKECSAHNTPPWMSIIEDCASLKTLLGKTLWDKKPNEGKEYIILRSTLEMLPH